MKNKISLIVVHILLATVSNINAMDIEESLEKNKIIVSTSQSTSGEASPLHSPRKNINEILVDNNDNKLSSHNSGTLSPKNTPNINSKDNVSNNQTPPDNFLLRKSISSDDLKKKLTLLAKMSPISSPSISSESSSRSRSLSPNRSEKGKIIGCFSHWPQDRFPVCYQSIQYRQDGDNFIMTVKKEDNDQEKEIIMQVEDAYQDEKFAIVNDVDGSYYLVELIAQQKSQKTEKITKELEDLLESNQTTIANNPKIEEKSETFTSYSKKHTKQTKMNNNNGFPKDPRHFVAGIGVLAIIVVLMYSYNKIPDVIINFINKGLPSAYSL